PHHEPPAPLVCAVAGRARRARGGRVRRFRRTGVDGIPPPGRLCEPVISVVCPVFNEEDTLSELHRRLVSSLGELAPYELVFVDDGSSDGSWHTLLGLAASDPSMRLVRLSRNFGHQAALSAGLDAARGDAVVLMDADLQDPPELIPDLVAKWREGYDVVYAVRADREGEPPLRLAAISLFYRLLHRITPTSIPENAGDFRLLSRRAVDAIVAMPERARFLRGMTSWIGYRQTGVPYTRERRFAGTSKYPARKLVRLALDGITSFSTAPIKLVTGIGFTLVVFCAGVLVWTLYVRFFTRHHPQGWTSVIAVVLMLGGVQLLSLGVIGQYVARIFDETKQRPVYLVDELIESLAAPQLLLEQGEPLGEQDVLVGEPGDHGGVMEQYGEDEEDPDREEDGGRIAADAEPGGDRVEAAAPGGEHGQDDAGHEPEERVALT